MGALKRLETKKNEGNPCRLDQLAMMESNNLPEHSAERESTDQLH